MKVAIIGESGLLGSNLFKYYSKRKFEVKAFSRSNSQNNVFIINFDNLEKSLSDSFNNWCPDIIINAVALVNLQKCEEDYDNAYYVNTSIAMKLATISKKYNSYFIHISTDHFFNDKKAKHSENAEVNLLNNYAKTKFDAENEVLKIYNKSLIVRTNIIGFRRNDIDSFFEWLLNSLQSKEKTKLFNNFFTSPLSVQQLAKFLIDCYEIKINGIYNIASSEVIDKYSFGLRTAKHFGYDERNIDSIKLDKTINGVDRALSLGLDVSKIENILDIKMPTIDETLQELHKEFKEANE